MGVEYASNDDAKRRIRKIQQCPARWFSAGRSALPTAVARWVAIGCVRNRSGTRRGANRFANLARSPSRRHNCRAMIGCVTRGECRIRTVRRLLMLVPLFGLLGCADGGYYEPWPYDVGPGYPYHGYGYPYRYGYPFGYGYGAWPYRHDRDRRYRSHGTSTSPAPSHGAASPGAPGSAPDGKHGGRRDRATSSDRPRERPSGSTGGRERTYKKGVMGSRRDDGDRGDSRLDRGGRSSVGPPHRPDARHWQRDRTYRDDRRAHEPAPDRSHRDKRVSDDEGRRRRSTGRDDGTDRDDRRR